MIFEKALDQVVKEGAIRLWRVSGVWAIAYRLQDGQFQARGLVHNNDQWQLQKRMAGKSYRSADGWYPVQAMHQNAGPITLEAAEKNPGYFMGTTRQCATCQKYKPLSAFNPDMSAGGYRTWECKDCAGERHQALDEYHQRADEHVGDYIRRPAHTSRPPVEGEI